MRPRPFLLLLAGIALALMEKEILGK